MPIHYSCCPPISRENKYISRNNKYYDEFKFYEIHNPNFAIIFSLLKKRNTSASTKALETKINNYSFDTKALILIFLSTTLTVIMRN